MELISEIGFKWFWFLIELSLILVFFRLSKSSFKEYLIVFSICYMVGMVVDWIGLQVGFWYYPRMERTIIWTGLAGPLGYAAIGSVQYFSYKFVRGKLPPYWALLVVTNGMFLLHEGINLVVGSWVYSLPIVVVYFGWYLHVAWTVWIPRLVMQKGWRLVVSEGKV